MHFLGMIVLPLNGKQLPCVCCLSGLCCKSSSGTNSLDIDRFSANEPRREKTGLRGLRPGPTQTGLKSHRR